MIFKLMQEAINDGRVGVCADCGKPHPLTKRGRLFSHSRWVKEDALHWKVLRCAGSGDEPAVHDPAALNGDIFGRDGYLSLPARDVAQ